MNAFDDTVDAAVLLLGEGVQLAWKGVAETISMEMEGKEVNVGELLLDGYIPFSLSMQRTGSLPLSPGEG